MEESFDHESDVDNEPENKETQDGDDEKDWIGEILNSEECNEIISQVPTTTKNPNYVSRFQVS